MTEIILLSLLFVFIDRTRHFYKLYKFECKRGKELQDENDKLIEHLDELIGKDYKQMVKEIEYEAKCIIEN